MEPDVKSYSQAGQDVWVWEMLEHKTAGFYVDLGCGDPVAVNNTFAFEQMGWDGILVDLLAGCETRKGRFFKCDATSPTPELLEAYRTMPLIVDFLSLDLDEATLATFDTLPWDTHRVRVACIEHDAYMGRNFRPEIRGAMQRMGYTLVCGDVCIRCPSPTSDPGPFEDWFCDSKLVKHELIDRFRCSGVEWSEIVKGLTQ